MSESKKVVKLQGSIDLAALNVEYGKSKSGKNALVIPIDDNPAIFVTSPKNGGQRKVLLDIEVIPTPKSKYNTHMAKASVGKANLEKFGLDRNNRDQMAPYEPIMGNFNERDITPKGGPRDPMDSQQGSADDLPGDDEW